MPKMRGFLKTKEKIDPKDWELAQIRTAARLGDLFGSDAPSADKKVPKTEAEDVEAATVDTSGILVGPMPWSGGPRPPIVVVGVSEIVSVLADPDATAPTPVPSEPDSVVGSGSPITDAAPVDETGGPATPIGITGVGATLGLPPDTEARPIGVMARPGDAVGPDPWQLPFGPDGRGGEPELAGQPFQPSSPRDPEADRPPEVHATVAAQTVGQVFAPAAMPTERRSGVRLVNRVPITRPVVGGSSTALDAIHAPEVVPSPAVPWADEPVAIEPLADEHVAIEAVAVEPVAGEPIVEPVVERSVMVRPNEPARRAPARIAPAAKSQPVVVTPKPATKPAKAKAPAPKRPTQARVATPRTTPAKRRRTTSVPANRQRRTTASTTESGMGGHPTEAPSAPVVHPKTRVVRLETRVAPASAPVVAAHCPYCAKLLDPAPTTNKRCDRCRQKIVVKRIDGTAVYLTEAAVKVFDAERRRVHSSARWTRERDRWLGHARLAGAPAERIATLTAARLSEDVVAAARKLYLTTVDRAFRAAKNERAWDAAARIRRDEAALLHRASGSPPVPQAEVVALYREGVASVLRGVAEIARDAELVSARCCDACRADDGAVVRISSEIRSPRLPHVDCPKGLCRCDWDLPARHRQTLRRYLRRKPTPEVRAVASETRALPRATRAES
jgi:hypothetical protein